MLKEIFPDFLSAFLALIVAAAFSIAFVLLVTSKHPIMGTVSLFLAFLFVFLTLYVIFSTP